MSFIKSKLNFENAEFSLIEKYFNQPAMDLLNETKDNSIALGIGDDCALLNYSDTQYLAISTDTLVEGRHFFCNSDGADIAYKAFMVSVSDLAAMGATPKWFSLALTLPTQDETWLNRFSQQIFKLARSYGMQLIGGDTTKGPLTITLVVKGLVDKKNVLLRSAARSEDDIYVTGSLGASALGLALLQHFENKSSANYYQLVSEELRNRRFALTESHHIDYQLNYDLNKGIDNSVINKTTHENEKIRNYIRSLIHAYHFPYAQVIAANSLLSIAHAAIDISDGLASDLKHICSASHLTAQVNLEQLPLSPEFKYVYQDLFNQQSNYDEGMFKLALQGGDDYQLCFTAHRKVRRLIEKLSAKLNLPITRIGSMRAKTESKIEYFAYNKRTDIEVSGFDHFRLEV